MSSKILSVDTSHAIGGRLVPRTVARWTNREALSPAVWLAAGSILILHLATAGRYGIFRDELYYLACADHLDWGYVDHPPLSIAFLGAWRTLFGESLTALRVVPALAASVLVMLTAVLARSLGGRRWAQALGALGVATMPGVAVMTGFYSMNAFDLLFWVVALLTLVTLAREDRPRLWLLFGAVVGVGLLDKLTLGFLAVAVAAAVPFTPLRRHLRTRYPWLGALLALVLFSPHLIWQATRGWPTAEFVANAARYKIAALGMGEWWLIFALLLGPAAAVLWLPGTAWLLAAPAARRCRIAGLATVVVVGWIALQGGKPYYALPVAPLLFAAGGVAVERMGTRRRWVPGAVAGIAVASNALLLPIAIPLLSPESLVVYQSRLGIAPPTIENRASGSLPQHFADRFGWKEMTAAVADVWLALPEAERQRTVIVTGNYGEAGAIRYFGPAYGLPAAASQHNSYFHWGPGKPLDEIDTVLAVGIPPQALLDSFAEVEPAGRVDHPWAMPYETGEVLWIARQPKRPLEEAWREGKHFI